MSIICCSRSSRLIAQEKGIEETIDNLFSLDCITLRHSIKAILANLPNLASFEDIIAYEATSTLSDAPTYRLSLFEQAYTKFMTCFMTTDFSDGYARQLADLASSFGHRQITTAITDAIPVRNAPAYIKAILCNSNTEEVDQMRRDAAHTEYIAKSPLPSLPKSDYRAFNLRLACENADRDAKILTLLSELGLG